MLPQGWTLIARGTVGSTNDEARALVAAGQTGRFAVTAERQTAGRGRRGRAWASPPGNLYCSLVIAPPVAADRLGETSLVAGLAVGDAVAAILDGVASVGLKWPNDVLVRGRKVAGILVEAEQVPGADRKLAAIVGVGINLLSAPTETSYPAAALSEFGPTPDRAVMLGAVVGALDRWVARWDEQGFAAIRSAWLGRAYGLGTEIRTEDGLVGRFSGLDAAGAIEIAAADGQIHRVTSGSIRYL